MSVNPPKSGHKTDAFHPAKRSVGAKFRNIFNNYLLKPLVIGTAVIVLNSGAFSPSASSKTPSKKASGDIILQADTLALQPSIKSKPLPPATQAAVQSILSKISHAYPDVLKMWAINRQIDIPAELKPLELKLELVNNARFEQIEYTGTAVIFEPDARAILINSDVFNADSASHTRELAFALCYNFSSYGSFSEPVPFDAMGMLPLLMACSIAPSAPMPSPDGEKPPVLSAREAVALYFAQLIGIPRFVNDCAVGNSRSLSSAYGREHGPRSYGELLALAQWEGPGYPLPDYAEIMNAITRHIQQSGGKGTAWGRVEPLAKVLGYRIPQVQ